MGYPTRLVVYDFDWTLFRSPFPPAGGEGIVSWWDSLRSLSPPIVPRRPSARWWIGSTTRKFKADLKREDTIIAVITGRIRSMESRIAQLLQDASLHFDYLLTHDPSIRGEKDILQFKVNAAEDVLNTHKTISEISVWEDVKEQLDVFQVLAAKRGLGYHPHLVTELDRVMGWTP